MVRKILEEIDHAKNAFGTTCKKYTGSLTVEIIRNALSSNAIEISSRDVFIRGVPLEIDLLVAKKGIIPQNRLLYEPSDVLFVFEIKKLGSFGENTIKMIKNNFKTITKCNPDIQCFYITLAERRGFKWAITDDNLGFPAFTLFWYSGSGKNEKFESTSDWERLLDKIKPVIGTT